MTVNCNALQVLQLLIFFTLTSARNSVLLIPEFDNEESPSTLLIQSTRDGNQILNELNVAALEGNFEGDELKAVDIILDSQLHLRIDATPGSFLPHKTYQDVTISDTSHDTFWANECVCGGDPETLVKFHDLLFENNKLYSASIEFEVECKEMPAPFTCTGKMEWESPQNSAVPTSPDFGTKEIMFAIGISIVVLGVFFLVGNFLMDKIYNEKEESSEAAVARSLESAFRRKSYAIDMGHGDSERSVESLRASRRESEGTLPMTHMARNVSDQYGIHSLKEETNELDELEEAIGAKSAVRTLGLIT